MNCKFLRGIYKCRPTKHKYTHIWVVPTVLEYLKTIDINNPIVQVLKSLQKKHLC